MTSLLPRALTAVKGISVHPAIQARELGAVPNPLLPRGPSRTIFQVPSRPPPSPTWRSSRPHPCSSLACDVAEAPGLQEGADSPAGALCPPEPVHAHCSSFLLHCSPAVGLALELWEPSTSLVRSSPLASGPSALTNMGPPGQCCGDTVGFRVRPTTFPARCRCVWLCDWENHPMSLCRGFPLSTRMATCRSP